MHSLEAIGSGPATQLVGRERELAELQAALGAAREGRGRLYLIAGEPGIGKTRLAEVVADHGTRRACTRSGAEHGRTPAPPRTGPGPSSCGRSSEPAIARRSRPSSGRSCAGSGRCSPSRRSGGRRTGGPPNSEKARFAVFDAVGSFLHDVAAGEPLLIVLDDIHAADPASLLMLEFIAHGVPDASILVLATFQEAAARRRPEVERLVGALGRASPSITLRGFGDEDLPRWWSCTPGSDGNRTSSTSSCTTTDGNPFFTTEVLRLVGADARGRGVCDARGRIPTSHFRKRLERQCAGGSSRSARRRCTCSRRPP